MWRCVEHCGQVKGQRSRSHGSSEVNIILVVWRFCRVHFAAPWLICFTCGFYTTHGLTMCRAPFLGSFEVLPCPPDGFMPIGLICFMCGTNTQVAYKNVDDRFTMIELLEIEYLRKYCGWISFSTTNPCLPKLGIAFGTGGCEAVMKGIVQRSIVNH